MGVDVAVVVAEDDGVVVVAVVVLVDVSVDVGEVMAVVDVGVVVPGVVVVVVVVVVTMVTVVVVVLVVVDVRVDVLVIVVVVVVDVLRLVQTLFATCEHGLDSYSSFAHTAHAWHWFCRVRKMCTCNEQKMAHQGGTMRRCARHECDRVGGGDTHVTYGKRCIHL